MPMFLTMTLLKPRPARIAACLLVGALVMVPLSANAAPTGAVPNDDLAAASYRANNEDDPAKNAEKEAVAAAKEAERVAEAAAREEARVAEAAAREEARVAEAAAREEARVAEEVAKEEARVAEEVAKEEARVAEEVAKEEARVAEAAAREEEKAAEEDPVGAVTGPGGASPSPSPVGATPAEGPPDGAAVSIDQVLVPTHLSAAMELFDQQAEASSSVPAPVTTPTGMVSGSLVRELAPVLPPLLTDVVAAPFVVIEALIAAMAASGQALVIPLLAGAAGFMAPVVRRKHLLAEALGKNSEPVPSNEPRTVFIGW